MKLIQGFFVQYREGLLDIAYGEDGPQAVVRKGLVPHMYAGAVFDDDAGSWSGEMMDPQGESRLFDIIIDDSSIRFTKQYVRHELLGPDRRIFYTFGRREGNTWVGKWRYRDSAIWGPSRCVITDVDEKLFRSDVLDFLKSFPVGEFNPDNVRAYAEKS